MNVKKVILLIIIFIFLFCYVQFFTEVGRDEVWNYGFSFNIASGLIPYKDFNMLQTPLFFFIGSIFIKIFGSYLYSVNILISLVATIILFIISKEIKGKVYIFVPIMLLYLYYSYNVFCLLLILIIFSCIKNNCSNNDIFIPLLVSLTFLTKQSIGVCLVIPLIYYSKNKLKDIIIFLIPIFIFLIYLIYNDALNNFIDYSFLGMFDFSEKNGCYIFLIFELPVCTFLLYHLIKSFFKDRLCFYALMFQVISYPIMDPYHFMFAFIIFLYYLFLKYEINNKFNKYFIVIAFSWFFFNYNLPNNLNFYSNSFLEGRLYSVISESQLKYVKKFILNKSDKYDMVYIFAEEAYLFKLYSNIEINKFDLILNGNMGYNGGERYIVEIDSNCRKHSCLFILGGENENQISVDILKYVRNNYNEDGMLLDYFSVYSNR